MNNQENNKEKESESVDKKRRSLAKAGLTTPVIMSIFSRPAFAQQCSGSVLASGNLSNAVDINTCGACNSVQWGNATDAELESIGLSFDTEIGAIFTFATIFDSKGKNTGETVIFGSLKDALGGTIQIHSSLRFKNVNYRNNSDMSAARSQLQAALAVFTAAYLNASHIATQVNFTPALNNVVNEVNTVLKTNGYTRSPNQLDLNGVLAMQTTYIELNGGDSCAINQKP